MKPKYTFLPPSSFLLTLFLLLLLAITVGQSGGLAFSSGPLSGKGRPGVTLKGFASHAEFDQECGRCHQPFKTIQSTLCMDCHEGVAEQARTGSGLHGALPGVTRCFECHSEHKGRSYDLLEDDLASFDHSITGFHLILHQVTYEITPLECRDCHMSGEDFTFSNQACIHCHTRHDNRFVQQHILDFDEDCLACHDGLDSMVGFDHNATAFPLDGSHTQISCAQCHTRGNFQDVPRDCFRCHQEPAIHAGLLGRECSTCHNSSSWIPALLDGQPFDHLSRTSFSLALHQTGYDGQTLNCRGCHSEDIRNFDRFTCFNCHSDHDSAFMQEHISQFNPSCLDCHDGIDRMHNFDHSVFPLEGRHGETQCEACHQNEDGSKTFGGTPVECVRCHAEPQIHAGFFGLQCQYCHITSEWAPAELRVHSFPLDHGEPEQVSCLVCHAGSYAEYTCYGCHEHEPEEIAKDHAELNLTLDELNQCSACHPDGVEPPGEGGH